MVNFVLEALETTVTMSEFGILEAGVAPGTLTGALVTVPVASADFRDIFKFQSDSVDFTDADATDIKYYVYESEWDANFIHPANGVVTDSDAVGGISGATLKQDFVRHMALELFNTHHAVDLFTNEEDLIGDLEDKCDGANDLIKIQLAKSNATAASKPTGMAGAAAPWHRTRDDQTDENFSGTLFRQLLSVEPARLKQTTENEDLSAIRPIPFQQGDSISFNLIVNAASHSTIFGAGVTPTPTVDPRTYVIKLDMTS